MNLKIDFMDRYNDVSEENVQALVNSGEYWMEEKLDGIRAGITKTSAGVKIMTKNHIDITSKFPDIADQMDVYFAGYPWVLDGEIISRFGHNDVQSLLASNHATSVKYQQGITFHPFDMLMHPHDPDLFRKQLRLRRIQLEMWKSPFVAVPQWTILAEMMSAYEALRRSKREGIVLKRWADDYNKGNKWYRSKFVQTVSVYPVDIDDETLMVKCAMLNRMGDWRHVCDVQVDMDDIMILLNHMGDPSAEIWPALEVAVYGVDDKGNLRHTTYKGLRFETDAGSVSLEQLTKLRRY